MQTKGSAYAPALRVVNINHQGRKYVTYSPLLIAGLEEAQALGVVAPRFVPVVHKHPRAVDVALPISVSCICTFTTCVKIYSSHEFIGTVGHNIIL